MNFNWITPGELAEDQYVTMYRIRPQSQEVLLPTGEVRTVTQEDKNPWIKGIPFRVAKVNLPLVMLENVCHVPNIPPAVFYDTQLVEFIEVDKDYADKYAQLMYPQNKTPQLENRVPVLIIPKGFNPPIKDEDDQEVFRFGDDEEDEDPENPEK